MNSKSKRIVTSADSKYFPALMALLRSIKKTNPDIPVTVFDGGLTSFQKRKACRFAELITCGPPLTIKGTGKFSYIGNTTLLKLRVSELSYDVVLYLDVDMVVLEDISALFSVPGGKVGVVKEINTVRNMFRSQHRDAITRGEGLKDDDRGFNAGLFVLRPSEWRDLIDKAKRLVEKYGEAFFSKSKDQQLLNIIFKGCLHELSPRYNFSPFYDDIVSGSPGIIHYLSACKPWHSHYPGDKYYGAFRASLKFVDYPVILWCDICRWFRKRRLLLMAYKTLLAVILSLTICSGQLYCQDEGMFSTFERKEKFARELCSIIEKSWKEWQDKVDISGVQVDGSQGILHVGGIKEPVLTKKMMLGDFSEEEEMGKYFTCISIVASAIENGMRRWQRDYASEDIVFTQGASCLYTLTPCENIPVSLDFGKSSGRAAMNEEALYDFMSYRALEQDENYLVVFGAAAYAISVCFDKWENNCLIEGITASGGVAPKPSSLGQGPGPVRGAIGNGGKLKGDYFDSDLMYQLMCEYFAEWKNIVSHQQSVISNQQKNPES